jgi:hypothetical protein
MATSGSSDDGLRGAVMASLESSGAAEKIRASIRAQVHAALNDDTVALPEMTAELFLCSEVVRDFLAFMKCDTAISVMDGELGRSGSLSRDILAHEIGLSAPRDATPLLLLLLEKHSSRTHIQSAASEA